MIAAVRVGGPRLTKDCFTSGFHGTNLALGSYNNHMNFLRNVFTRGRQPGPRWRRRRVGHHAGHPVFRHYHAGAGVRDSNGSMENTILIGDHMLVDKLAYADPGAIGRSLLPL